MKNIEDCSYLYNLITFSFVDTRDPVKEPILAPRFGLISLCQDTKTAIVAFQSYTNPKRMNARADLDIKIDVRREFLVS